MEFTIDRHNSNSSQRIPWHWRHLRGGRELHRAARDGRRANRRSRPGETEAIQSSRCLPNDSVALERVDDRAHDVAFIPGTSSTTYLQNP